jgi:hypothetical protein
VTKQIDMAQLNPSGDIDEIFIRVKNLSYDEYGRPIVPEPLDERPIKKGRIQYMKSHGPSLDRSTELVVTSYYYNDASDIPVRTEINSIPDNRIRIVRP